MAQAVGTKEISNKAYDRAQLAMMAGQVRETRKLKAEEVDKEEQQPNWANNASLKKPKRSKKQIAKNMKEAKVASKKQAAKKTNVKEKAEMRATMPARRATSWLLRLAWLNAWATFGLTLIYVDLHILGGLVMGKKFFVNIGEEWTPEYVRKGSGELGKTSSMMLGIAEGGLLFMMHVVFFLVLLLSLLMVYLVVDIYLHTLDFLWSVGFKGIFSIFKTIMGF